MIPLFKPHMPELPELLSVLGSGQLSYGTYCRKFENELRSFLGNEQVAVTNSYSSAINVVLSAIDVRPGDELIISPMSCLVSTQSFAASGAKLVWADIDNHRGTLDPESVRKKITTKTKCIIHNHFCGYPGHIAEVNLIGQEHGIPVIDDGIEGFGGEYQGMKIGNCGSDITVFSFAAVRNPNAIEGGAFAFRDKNLFEKALLARDCGIERSRFRDELGEIDPRCDIKIAGFSAMMSDVNGYIGCRQMAYLEGIIGRQRSNAEHWDSLLSAGRQFKPLDAGVAKPNYWVYGVLSNEARHAIQYVRSMGLYASAVHINNDAYSIFGRADGSLEGVKDFRRRFIAVPSGWWFDATTFSHDWASIK